MISAMLLHIVGATEHAIIDDYVAGWRGAAAHAGHAWVYDPNEGNWHKHQQEPTGAEDLEHQLADRMPALREWIATFDATDLLAPDELRVIRALLPLLLRRRRTAYKQGSPPMYRAIATRPAAGAQVQRSDARTSAR